VIDLDENKMKYRRVILSAKDPDGIRNILASAPCLNEPNSRIKERGSIAVLAALPRLALRSWRYALIFFGLATPLLWFILIAFPVFTQQTTGRTMAEIQVEDGQVSIPLSFAQKIGALHGDLHFPVSA